MRLIALSVFDEKAGRYANPFFVPAIGVGTRLFGDWVNDANTAIHRHPGDYKLYQVGHFDDVAGVLEVAEVPLFLTAAIDHVEQSGSVPQLREVPRG